MAISVRAGKGRQLQLGELLKSGGAGSVYRVREDSSLVAKIYHDHVDHPVYQRKVEAMLDLSPQLPDLVEGARRYVQIAWPSDLLRDERGKFLGFVMPAVDIKSTSELEVVLQERQARAAGLPTGLGAKMTLAANLAAVIGELHRQHHRVVDLKPVNLRFYPQSLYMAMLDCDGFSIQGKGERFPAPQYTADYLAPEFQAGGITVVGEEQQDRFALAVIIFQLLNFGIHPFTGRPVSSRVPTDIPGRIAGRFYGHGVKPDAELQPNMASGHAAMPMELRNLFDRAFDGPGLARPTPLEWSVLLRGYAQRSSLRLVSCTRDRDHQHFSGYGCAACNRAQLIAKTMQQGEAARNVAEPTRNAARSAPWGAARKQPPPPPAQKPGGRLGKRARKAAQQGRPNLPRQRPFPPPPPPPLQNIFLVLISGYHRMFGLRGWAFVLFMLWVLLSATRESKDNVEDDYDRYRPAPTEIIGDRQIDPSFDDPVPMPPPLPAASPETILPIASGNDLPRAQWPGMLAALEDVRDDAIAVAGGMAEGNFTVTSQGMKRLRRISGGGSPPRASNYEPYARRFQQFNAAVQGGEDIDPKRRLAELHAHLLKHPFDADATAEWGWWAVLAGDPKLAEDAFIRTIWADPDFDGGWYGLGTVAREDSTRFGALAMAERLRLYSEADARRRVDMTRALLDRTGGDMWRFSILQARGQRRAAQMRGDKVPREVETLANELLPTEATVDAAPAQ